MPKIHTPEQLAFEAQAVFNQCALVLSDYEKASHLAYRTNSTGELTRVLDLARHLGTEILDEHQGRTYHWILLHKPLEHGNQRIVAYEFPAPKKGPEKPEGFYACVCVVSHRKAASYEKSTPKGMLLRMLTAAPAVLAKRQKAA